MNGEMIVQGTESNGKYNFKEEMAFVVGSGGWTKTANGEC